MYKELMIGAGSNHTRRMNKYPPGSKEAPFQNLVTLDFNPDHCPDVVWDLNDRPLPFDDNEFDELHAYEVLEHIGKQGDFRAFFEEFSEYHRILKPGGIFYASVPCYNGMWAWGDPSHVRIISVGTLAFLSQDQYRAQVGVTPMSDFRNIYKADFHVLGTSSCEREGTFFFLLKAIK